MSNIDPKEICGNCIHFAKEQRGECRKYAPRGGGDRMWTHVREDEWCSEFEKSEDAVPASNLPNQNAKTPKSLEDVASGKR